MSEVCRYCHELEYPIPERGNTIALEHWNGEWARVMCYVDAQEIVTKILVEFSMRLQRMVFSARASKSK